jgi:hypothetical protein
VPLEISHVAFVLFGGRAGLERTEIAALAGPRIGLAGIQPVLAGLQLSDHGGAPITPSGNATTPAAFLQIDGLFGRLRSCYICFMTTAEEIEKAIERLAPGELARLRAWFTAFDAVHFDATIEQGAAGGKLDALANEALAEHRAGRSREL